VVPGIFHAPLGEHGGEGGEHFERMSRRIVHPARDAQDAAGGQLAPDVAEGRLREEVVLLDRVEPGVAAKRIDCRQDNQVVVQSIRQQPCPGIAINHGQCGMLQGVVRFACERFCKQRQQDRIRLDGSDLFHPPVDGLYGMHPRAHVQHQRRPTPVQGVGQGGGGKIHHGEGLLLRSGRQGADPVAVVENRPVHRNGVRIGQAESRRKTQRRRRKNLHEAIRTVFSRRRLRIGKLHGPAQAFEFRGNQRRRAQDRGRCKDQREGCRDQDQDAGLSGHGQKARKHGNQRQDRRNFAGRENPHQAKRKQPARSGAGQIPEI